MAQLNNLIVTGSTRLLNKLYCSSDIQINGSATIDGSMSINSLSVGGYNNTSYSLSANSFIVNDWVRTVGNTGWYNQTHDGGWYMNDDNYIRNYHKPVMLDKNLYMTASTTNNYLGTDGNLYYDNITSSNVKASKVNSNDIESVNANFTGTLRSYKYDIQTIADLGGEFIVAPTIIFPSNDTGKIYVTYNSANQLTFTIVDESLNSDQIAGFTWNVNCKVKVTANINGTVFSNQNGYISTVETSTNRLVIIVENLLSTITSNFSDYTTATEISNSSMSVMLYNADTTSASSEVNASNTKPVGIVMQSYGLSKNPYIDIFNGTGNVPKVRFGYLNGLTYNNKTLGSIWGLYGEDVYLTGSIVATDGKIGGWIIGDDYLTSDSNRTVYNANIKGITMNPTGIGAGDDDSCNFYLDQNGNLFAIKGTVGGWNLDAQSLYSNNVADDPTSSGDTIRYVARMNKYNDTDSTTGKAFEIYKAQWIADDTSVTIQHPFYVRYDGYLFSNYGSIGGFSINETTLYNNDVDSTEAGSISLSSVDFKRKINDTIREDLRFAIGSNFGVKDDGTVYASNVIIKGEVTATSGFIGDGSNGFYIDEKAIYNGMTSLLDTTHEGVYIGVDGISLGKGAFTVTKEGDLTANSATIKGNITAESGFIGTDEQGFNINSYYISNGMKSLNDTDDNGVYIGTDGIALGKGVFKVTNAGVLTASSATITGDITANVLKTGTRTDSSSGVGIYADSNGNFYAGSGGTYTLSYSATDNVLTVKNIVIGSNGYLTTNSSRTSYKTSTSGLTFTNYGIGAGNGTSNTFYVDTSGYLYSINGSIGGFTIGSNAIYNNSATSTSAKSIYLTTSTFSRSINNTSRSSLSFAIGSNFAVSNSGIVYASNLVATGGTIGGWTIGSSSIYNGTNSSTSTTSGLYLGTTCIRGYTDSTHYFNFNKGTLTCTGATISGSITATEGTIGGFTIESNRLYGTGVSLYSSITSDNAFIEVTNNGSDLTLGPAYISASSSSGANTFMYSDGSIILHSDTRNVTVGEGRIEITSNNPFPYIDFSKAAPADGVDYTSRIYNNGVGIVIASNDNDYSPLTISNEELGASECSIRYKLENKEIGSVEYWVLGKGCGSTGNAFALWDVLANAVSVSVDSGTIGRFHVYGGGGESRIIAHTDNVNSYFYTNTDGRTGIFCDENKAGGRSQNLMDWDTSGDCNLYGTNAIYTHVRICPYTDDHSPCGDDTHKWISVWSTNGTIKTSDEREKNILGLVDKKYIDSFLNLKTIQFKWKDKDDSRIHVGFGAQTTESIMIKNGINENELVGIYHNYKDTPNKNGFYDSYSMQYEEILCLAVPVIQDDHRRIEELEKELQELKQIINNQ